MKYALYDFDVFPMVFLAGREQKITVKGRNRKTLSRGVHRYVVSILEMDRAEDGRYDGSGCRQDITVDSLEDGTLEFSAVFPKESEYLILLHRETGRHFAELNVYALGADMKGRYPFRGDLHMHSNRSDGHDDPAAVAANYRGHGYDFTVLSDHERYYPSLEARNIYRIGKDDESPLTDLLVVPGEEVHLPLNAAHYVNFGSSFSINGLVTPNNNQEAGDGPEARSLDGNCPPTMTRTEYEAMIRERAKSVPREIESERLSFASLQWIYEQIQAGGGLGIFPHPYWLCSTMQLSEDFTKFVYEQMPFDAFEVLGGENYFQHNGYQTGFYYAERALGFDPPVVGSTDSHGSTENNRNSLICSTLVFAPRNTAKDLIAAIKDKYSVAVDTISTEYRLVGDFRWLKYGSFLLENWYPIHDRACKGEGYYMREFAYGDPNAENVLRAMKGQVPGMLAKYFDVE